MGRRRDFRAGCLVILAVATVGCGPKSGGVQAAVTTAPASTAPASAAPAAAAPTSTSAPAPPGVAFTAADGRFTARFPVVPKRTENVARGLTFVSYISVLQDDSVSAGFVDRPPPALAAKDQPAFLRTRMAVEGVVQFTDTSFLGRPALDTVLHTVEGGVDDYRLQRSFLVGSRMYMLHGRSSSPTPTPAYAMLLASFALS